MNELEELFIKINDSTNARDVENLKKYVEELEKQLAQEKRMTKRLLHCLKERNIPFRETLQGEYTFLHPSLNSLMIYGFECGDGWLGLLAHLFQKINTIVQRDELDNFEVVQVKQKFGGLRVYVRNANEKILQLTHEAEKKSTQICEICGCPGKLRNDRSYIMTTCEEHNEKEI